MDRLRFALWGFLVYVLTAFMVVESAVGQPNVVFILADDMGWGDTTCNNAGSKIETPNIDRLAKQGVRFTHAYAPAAVCTPTRYGLLTGRYSWRTPMREGVLYGYCPSLIRKNRMTLASLLKEGGYTTGAFGKWHLGLDWTPVTGDPGDWEFGTPVRRSWRRIAGRVDHAKAFRNGPTDLGFDTYYGISDNPGFKVYLKDDRIDGPTVRDPRGGVMHERFRRDEIDDICTNKAIEFIERVVRQTPKKPFFVYLPLTSAHSPLQPPDRLQGKSGDGLHGDMVLWIDENVGEIAETLERLKVADNTLVIFSSDNGSYFNGDRDNWTVETGHSPNGSYRGYKTDAWEGGTRVPFVARWPGRIPAGATSDQIVCLTDMMATLAALTGTELPRWVGEDSFNMLPAMLGEERARPIRESLITHSYTGIFSVRSGPWKAIFDTNGSGGHRGVTPNWAPIVHGIPEAPASSGVGQLYKIDTDPYEKYDLWDKRPDVVKDLAELLQKYTREGRSRP